MYKKKKKKNLRNTIYPQLFAYNSKRMSLLQTNNTKKYIYTL